MGRAKLKMEYIVKEKSRHLTFKKRKEGLIKKIKEFTTLCDVRACMIIYGPEDCSTQPPLIWPQNLDEVTNIINIYKSKNKDCENRAVGLADFLKDRSKKIEEEVSKLQEANYFTSAEFLEDIAENHLREFVCELNGKIDVVCSKIEMMKMNANGGYMVHAPETSLFHLTAVQDNAGLNTSAYSTDCRIGVLPLTNGRLLQPYANNNNNTHNTHNTPCLVQRGIELELTEHQHQQQQQSIFGFNLNPLEIQVPPPIHYPILEQDHHQIQHSLSNPNSMMMMMMLKNHDHNDHQTMQFGGVQCASSSYAHQALCYDSSSSSQDVNNLLYDDSAYLTRYLSAMQQTIPPPQPPPPPYMQCATMMPNMVVPSVSTPVNNLQDKDNGGDNIDHSTAKY